MATVIFHLLIQASEMEQLPWGKSPQNTGHYRQPFGPRGRLSLHLHLLHQVSLSFISVSVSSRSKKSTRHVIS